MQYDVEIQTDHMTKLLKAVLHEIATPRQMLGSIGETLLNANNTRHAQGLAPDGSKWKPLAPLTIGTKIYAKQKESFRNKHIFSLATARKVSGSSRILYDSGQMMEGFHYQVNDDHLRLGFDGERAAKLARWHHFGTGTFGPTGKPYVIKPVNKKALGFAGIAVKRVNHPGIPARQLVGYPESDDRAVGAVVTDHLLLVLKRVR